MTRSITTADRHDETAYFGLSLDFANHEIVGRFTVDGEPSSKARARYTKRGHAYTPAKTRAAEEAMGWAYRAAGGRAGTNAAERFGVVGIFFAKTRQRRDVDNMLKLVLDGLNGVAWVDDSQVLEVCGRKVFVDSVDEARSEVLVYRLGDAPDTRPECLECGKRFDTYPSWTNKAYCSLDCNLAERRRARLLVCEHCGETFDPGKPSQARFCSRDCRSQAGRVDVSCEHCGISFSRQRCFVRSRNYCSPKCRDAAAAPRRLVGALGVCADCGGPTSKKKYERCISCSRKARSRWDTPLRGDRP